MRIKSLHSRDEGGALIVATTIMALFMIGMALATLQGAYRAQNATRSTGVTNELATKDLELRRQTADNLMQQLVSAINAGSTNATLGSNLSASYATGTIGNGAGASTDGTVSLNLSDSGAASNRSVTDSGNSVSLTVSTWAPASSLFASLTLPSGPFRLKGGTIFGREFRVNYTRTITVDNNLAGSSTSSTSSRTLSSTASSRVIEFPSQTAVWGKNVRVRPVGTVSGSIVGQNVQLDAGTSVSGSVTVSRALTTAANVTVGGVALPIIATASASASLAKSLEAASTPIGPDIVSVIRGNESAALIELGDRTLDAEGIPQILLPAASAANWDAYSRPYYQCSTRITAKLNATGTSAAYAIRRSTTGSLATRLTSAAFASGTLTRGAASATNGLRLIARGADTVLYVDAAALSSAVGGTYARAVHVDLTNNANLRLAAATRLCVALIGASDLSALGGFSLVTPNRLVLAGQINNSAAPVPMSIFAYAAHYGFTIPSSIIVSGQVANLGTPNNADNDVFGMRALDSTSVPDLRKTLTVSDISAATQLPPVTLLNWLVLTYEN